jgi:hypothetical protein
VILDLVRTVEVSNAGSSRLQSRCRRMMVHSWNITKIILIDCFVLGGKSTFMETNHSWYIPKILKNNTVSSVAKKKTFLENNQLKWNSRQFKKNCQKTKKRKIIVKKLSATKYLSFYSF